MHHGQAHGRERRITQQLAAFWESCRDGAQLPSSQALESAAAQNLGAAWPDCFVVSVEEIAEGANNYTYAHLGEAIRNAYEEKTLDARDDRSPLASTRASRLHRTYRQLLETRRPVMVEGEFINKQGHQVKYRQCLLPFVNKRNEVCAVLGGMRFKLEEKSVLVAA